MQEPPSSRSYTHVTLRALLLQAKDWSDGLQQVVEGKKFAVGARGDLGVSLLQHSWDIADAIRILLENNLPGPAWALARPLCESFIRSIWIQHCASDKEVEKFQAGNCPNLAALVKEIGNRDCAEPHAWWIRENMKNRLIFHDFTHGGIEHVLRRLHEGVVGQHYPEPELKYLVGLVMEMYRRVGYELLLLVGETQAAIQLLERTLESWNKAMVVSNN